MYQINSEVVGKMQNCAVPDAYDSFEIYDRADDKSRIPNCDSKHLVEEHDYLYLSLGDFPFPLGDPLPLPKPLAPSI